MGCPLILKVKPLAFIRRCCELGLPLDTVREFLKLVDQKNSTYVEIADISQHHLQDIRAKDPHTSGRSFSIITKRCAGPFLPHAGFSQ